MIPLLPLFLLAAQAVGGDFRINHDRGEALIRQGDLNGAVPYLRRAWTIDPSNHENAWDLALSCLKTKRVDEAREVVESALKRSDRSDLHNLMGDIEEAAGRTLEAVRQYETAARADPTEKHVFDLATELLSHTGFAQAIQIFEFGSGKYPDSARLRVGLGIAYYSVGRYADAVGALCQAVDLDPRDTRALRFLGEVRDVAPAMGDEVRTRLARFAGLYPDNPAANYYYALSLPGTGDGQKIEALLRRAADLDPTLADAHFQLGVLYEEQDRAEKAVSEFETAARVQPGMKQAHYRLAVLYDAQGLPDRARREREIFQSLPK